MFYRSDNGFALGDNIGSDLVPHVVWQDIFDMATTKGTKVNNEGETECVPDNDKQNGKQIGKVRHKVSVSFIGNANVEMRQKYGAEMLSAQALRFCYGLHNQSLMSFQQNLSALESQDMTLSFSSKWCHLLHEPFESGNFLITQWLIITKLIPDLWHENAFLTAVMHGHLSQCQWLANHMKLPVNFESVHLPLSKAVRKGYTDMVLWLAEGFRLTRHNVWISQLVCDCVESGDLQFCRWAKNQFNLTSKDVNLRQCEALQMAAKFGHLDICKWLLDAFDNRLTNEQDQRNERNDVVEDGAYVSMITAAAHNQIHVCQYLAERFNYSGPDFGYQLMSSSINWIDVVCIMPDTCLWIINYFEVPRLSKRNLQHLLLQSWYGKNTSVCRWIGEYHKMTTTDLDPRCTSTPWVLETWKNK